MVHKVCLSLILDGISFKKEYSMSFFTKSDTKEPEKLQKLKMALN